jgi:hypothetical protein
LGHGALRSHNEHCQLRMLFYSLFYSTLRPYVPNIHAAIQLTNQRQIIVNQFGFTEIQTTLLGCVDGAVESQPLFFYDVSV